MLISEKRSSDALTASWVRHQDELRAVQRLRWQVFTTEMGAELTVPKGALAGHDVDEFDDHCDHLMVRSQPADGRPPMVVGTYRVLSPAAAHRLGKLYIESEFDVSALGPWRPHLAELGRSCTHPDWRQGGVIMMLWSQLARFMHERQLEHVVGCVSVPLRPPLATVRGLCHELCTQHAAPSPWQAQPHRPLPMPAGARREPSPMPALIKGYLACGAKVLGAPAVDPDFGCADVPMWLSLNNVPPAYRRRFLKDPSGEAAPAQPRLPLMAEAT